jgi:hypothetical protein
MASRCDSGCDGGCDDGGEIECVRIQHAREVVCDVYGLQQFAEADARHIATWDPETCQEVVETMEEMRGALRRLRGFLQKETYTDWGTTEAERRLDALCARIRERTER